MAALQGLFMNPHASRQARVQIPSVVISAGICSLITTLFVATSNSFLHWYIIPVTIGGIIIGIDAVDWFRGKMDAFDPVGIVGVYGLHFFLLAPLLHVYWNTWLQYVTPPPDWRDWLGYMACLNVVGLLVYRFSRERVWRIDRSKNRPMTSKTFRNAERWPGIWILDKRRFFRIVPLVLFIAVVLQFYQYLQYGGILGYINAATVAATTNAANPAASDTASLEGTGWLSALAECLPIVAMMAYAVAAETRPRWRSWWVIIALVLPTFLVLDLLFGGLRASRSTIIWTLVWGVGIIHFRIRPVSKKYLLLGCAVMVVFMYFYGFYKSVGLGALQALQSAQARATLTQQTQRGDLQGTLLGDLGRSDIQAFLLYRITRPDSDYSYAWGGTYVADLRVAIPTAIWPNRPPGKVQAGTEAQFGRGSYVPGVWVSLNVYGLAGEAMLNFGPLAAPISFVALGLFVGWVRRMLLTLDPADARLLIYPFLVTMCIGLIVGDLDNNIFNLIKNILVPLLVVVCATKGLIVVSSRPHWHAQQAVPPRFRVLWQSDASATAAEPLSADHMSRVALDDQPGLRLHRSDGTFSA
jgi:hypothetical protein